MILGTKNTSKMRWHLTESLMKNEKCVFPILMVKPGLHKDTITVIDTNEKECHLLLMANSFNTHKSIGTNITIVLIFASI